MYETNIVRYRTCVCNINYHVVWCVKYRRKVITPQKEQLWIHSYYVETVGSVSEDAIRKYIENQSRSY